MRQVLKSLGTPSHVGLAYGPWARVGDDGKVPEDERAGWLSDVAGIAISPDYAGAYGRWEASFGAGDRLFKLELVTRLLVGHGNPSSTDVGLTVHHTWGVPMIPGSALKGLLAHYVDAVYGPDDEASPPWAQPPEARARCEYQGVVWNRDGRRMVRGPGKIFRSLFGAPDTEGDREMSEHGLEAGATAGLVTFHDALYVPGMGAEGDRPFATDVLTAHQARYYQGAGKHLPNDYDAPRPVAFLTVRPRVRFLFALSGPDGWTELAERMLRDALEQWGVGGKTSASYGRLSSGTGKKATSTAAGPARAEPLRSGARVQGVLLDGRTKRGGWKARHEPSGLEGSIQNTDAVPADAKPGDRVDLIVASVNAKAIDFKWPG